MKKIPKTSPKKGENIPDPDEEKYKEKRKPCIGFTYVDFKGNYGVRELFKKCKKGKSDVILGQLEEFSESIKKFNTLQELIDKYKPKDGPKAKDKESSKKIDELRSKYNVEADYMLHIHLKGNGKGPFVLHGFTIANIFEVVWIDPDHKKHECK